MTQKKIQSSQVAFDQVEIDGVHTLYNFGVGDQLNILSVGTGGMMLEASDGDVQLQASSGNVTLYGSNVDLQGTTNTVNTVPIVTTTGIQDLTNKRITSRGSGDIFAVNAGSGTLTPEASLYDTINYIVTGNITFGVPLGPINNAKLILRIKDNGTARTLTWNAIYRPIGVTLPTTTVISKMLYVAMMYNSTDTKWDVLSVAQEV